MIDNNIRHLLTDIKISLDKIEKILSNLDNDTFEFESPLIIDSDVYEYKDPKLNIVATLRIDRNATHGEKGIESFPPVVYYY